MGVIRFTRPSDGELEALAESQRFAPIGYPDALVGATAIDLEVPGFRRDRYVTILGGPHAGTDGTFDRAVAALKDWGPQRGIGITLAATGPIDEGTVVAMAAPLPLGHALAVCRVVDVREGPDHFGFAYGTLVDHPEEGEERFTITRRTRPDEAEEVEFAIDVLSRPRHPLARVGAPMARRLQARATNGYLAAVRRAAEPA